MNSRERVLRALKNRKPDRIPLFLATSPWNSDVVGGIFQPPWFWKPVNLPATLNPRIKPAKRNWMTYLINWIKKDNFVVVDEFGSLWYNPGNKTIGQVVNPRVLKSWDELKTLKTPKKTNRGRWWVANVMFSLFGKQNID